VSESRRVLRQLLSVLTNRSETVAGPTAKAHARVRNAAEPWLEHPAIQGFGIGAKVASGRRSRKLAVRVYVDHKRPRRELEGSPIPRTIKVPWHPEPLPTDVIAIGTMKLNANTQRVRPASPGFGIGAGTHFGTLGCVVRRKGEEGLYLLGSGHVIAVGGAAVIDQRITQPAARDGNPATDGIAQLSASTPIVFSAGFPNLVDAAVAKFDNPKDADPFIRLIGPPKGVSNKLRENMPVQKTGYWTDHTTSHIRDLHFAVAIEYPLPDGTSRRAGFRELVLCDRFADDGDSGAAILNEARELVGIHFSGSNSANAFCRMTYAFDALGLELP
jgi:hypothetical protein